MTIPLEREIEKIRSELNLSSPLNFEKNCILKPNVYSISVKLDQLIVEYMKQD